MTLTQEILLTTENRKIADVLISLLEGEGKKYSVIINESFDSLESDITSNNCNLLIVDFPRSGDSTCDIIKLAQRIDEFLPVIVIGKIIETEDTVRLIKSGAADVIRITSVGKIYDSIEANIQISELSKRNAIDKQLHKDKDKYYRQIADNSSDIVYFYKAFPDHGFTYINVVIESLTGYTQNEFYTDPELMNKIIHPEDKDKENEVERVLNSQPSTARIIRKDGKTAWIEQRSSFVYDDRGEIIALEGIIRDITDLVNSQLRIEHLNSVLKSIRSINHLITREKNRDVLLNLICQKLIETHGYVFVKIFLIDDTNSISQKYIAGCPEFNTGTYSKNDDSITCVKKALNSDKDIIFIDHKLECNKCSLADISDRIGVTVSTKLKHNNLILGVISVSLPKDNDFSDDERELFIDLANDISYGLYNLMNLSLSSDSIDLLNETQERYKHLFDNSPIGIYRSTPDGRIIAANNTLLKILGFDNIDDLNSINLENFEYDQTYSRSRFKEIIEEIGSIRGFESVWTRPDGSKVKLFENSHIVRDFSGTLLYYEGTIEDYSDKISAMDALRESEIKYRASFNSSRDGICIFTGDKIIIDANNQLLNITSYSFEEIVRLNLSELFPRVPLNETKKRIINLLDGIEPPLFETFITTKFNIDIPVEIVVTILRNCYGRDIVFQAYIRDLTEKRAHEKLIRNREERLRSIYKLSLMTDLTERELIEYALEEAVRLTESKVGYLHIVNNDQASLELFTWSKEVYKFCTATMEKAYPLSEAGVWADCARIKAPVIHNDYQSLLDKKGYPEGHFEVVRHMSIPVIDNGKVVLIAGVGNKESDYDENDTMQLVMFMDELWKILNNARKDDELKKLTKAIENSSIIIMITNKEGLIEYVNPQFTEITGYSAEFVSGKNPDFLRAGDQNEELYNELLDIIRSGKEWRGEFHNKKMNGELFWESAIISPVFNNANEITHYIAVKTDITEKKESEQKLLQSNLSLNLINKCYNTYLFVNERNELLNSFCEIAVDLLNYPCIWIGIIENNPNSPLYGVITPVASAGDSNANFSVNAQCFDIGSNCIAYKAAKNDSNVVIENFTNCANCIMANRDNSFKSAIALPLRENNLIVGAVLIHSYNNQFSTNEMQLLNDFSDYLRFGLDYVHEKSERIRFEAIQAEEKEKLAITLRNVTDGILTVNKGGFVTLMNNAAEIILNKSSNSLFNKLIYTSIILNDENDEVLMFNPFDIYFQQKKNNNKNVYYTLKNDNNELKKITIGINFLESANNKYNGLIIVLRDITNQMRIENQIALSQKLESVGQLAAGIAHEINTPMQFVGDNTYFLKDAFESFVAFHYALGLIVKDLDNNQKLDLFLKQLNAIRSEHDINYLLEEVPVAINRTMEGIERVRRIVLAMKNFAHPAGRDKLLSNINHGIEVTVAISKNEWKYVAELETHLDEKLPLVYCSLDEINQVLLNIIINAAHAIAEANKDATKLGKIIIETFSDDDFVYITISDTGCGISKDKIDRIYDPFFTTKEVGKGTGQGLAISHNIIVSNHHGEIYVDSTIGKGTKFTIKLPINDSKKSLI